MKEKITVEGLDTASAGFGSVQVYGFETVTINGQKYTAEEFESLPDSERREIWEEIRDYAQEEFEREQAERRSLREYWRSL